MSVWTTKSSPDKVRNYIVLKHTLPSINSNIMGVKFRGGYCVVEKNSKVYFNLKKVPTLKKAKEFPLNFLRELPFITRTSDIQTIFGRDVYFTYLNVTTKVDKEESIEKHLEDGIKCKHTNSKSENGLCGNLAEEFSPSGYCMVHLLQDSKIKELGFEIPLAIPKDKRYEFKQKLLIKLKKVKSEGKF